MLTSALLLFLFGGLFEKFLFLLLEIKSNIPKSFSIGSSQSLCPLCWCWKGRILPSSWQKTFLWLLSRVIHGSERSGVWSKAANITRLKTAPTVQKFETSIHTGLCSSLLLPVVLSSHGTTASAFSKGFLSGFFFGSCLCFWFVLNKDTQKWHLHNIS